MKRTEFREWKEIIRCTQNMARIAKKMQTGFLLRRFTRSFARLSCLFHYVYSECISSLLNTKTMFA